MAFFHDGKRKASVRASERGPAEVLCIGYQQLDELLTQSEATREALHQMAKTREADGMLLRRGVPA
jgi:CRP-like cAMP-binding protein